MKLLIETRSETFFSNEQSYVNVKSYSDAKQKWNAIRDENYFGASDYQYRDTGTLIDGKSKLRFSYNGRLWDMNDNEVKF